MRPPYSQLAAGRLRVKDGHGFAGRAEVEIVLGRKFCLGCGRWRHLCDFGRIRSAGRRHETRSRCYTCSRRQARYYRESRTPEQRALEREYQRFWAEAKRREQGLAPRRWDRRTVIDRTERVLLPVDPIRQLLMEHFGEWRELARLTEISERTISRLAYEQAHVRIDIADRIALALGEPLGLLYLDARGG